MGPLKDELSIKAPNGFVHQFYTYGFLGDLCKSAPLKS